MSKVLAVSLVATQVGRGGGWIPYDHSEPLDASHTSLFLHPRFPKEKKMRKEKKDYGKISKNSKREYKLKKNARICSFQIFYKRKSSFFAILLDLT